jgi:hypothetical protein
MLSSGRCLHENATFGSSQVPLPGVNANFDVLIFYGKLSGHLGFNEVLNVTNGEDCVSFLHGCAKKVAFAFGGKAMHGCGQFRQTIGNSTWLSCAVDGCQCRI